MDFRKTLTGSDWSVTGWYTKQWRLQASMELQTGIPPVVPPIPATVPGAIQADLLRAGWIKDPNVGLQSLDMEWVNNRDWVLEKRFRVADAWLQDRCELVFEGIDYAGEIYLNHQLLSTFKGMFQPVVLDVTDGLVTGEENENILQVVLFTAPWVDGQIGHSHRIDTLKARFNYAWDWCPRMVSVGIWRDVYLRTFAGLKIVDFYPEATLDETLRQGTLTLHSTLEVLQPGPYRLAYRLIDEAGVERWAQEALVDLMGHRPSIDQTFAVGPVEAWWPNGYGPHPTYTISVTIFRSDGTACDSATKTVGFRTVEFQRNPGSPNDSLPYTLTVNGRRIFMKGINWVPLSPLYGTVQAEDYHPVLERFAAMQANLLRVWGGGIYEHEAFYSDCDRLGLMVWQEFLQSSSGLTNSPPENPKFLDDLEAVSRHGILQLRSHPSLVLWCGGNELAWEGPLPVDERHLNIRRLKRLVQAMDPSRQFWPTSPSGPRSHVSPADIGKGLHHDVHGPWKYLGPIDHYTLFNADDALFRSETGAPGTSRWATIRRYAGSHPVWPPSKDNPYWLHRGSWWIQWEELTALFGSWDAQDDDLQSYVQMSRYLQMEALRYAVEATRRREPLTSGFVVWMGNEPFPNNSNTSVLEYDGTPKPAYYALKTAFAAKGISVQYDRIHYRPGSQFCAEIFFHQELPTVSEGWVIVRIFDARGALLADSQFAVHTSGPSENIGTFEWQVTDCSDNVFLLRTEWVTEPSAKPIMRRDYLFTTASEHPFEPLRRLPPVDVEASMGSSGHELQLTNKSERLAVGLFLYSNTAGQALEVNSNYCNLLPGEQVRLRWEGEVSPHDLVIEGLNMPLRALNAIAAPF